MHRAAQRGSSSGEDNGAGSRDGDGDRIYTVEVNDSVFAQTLIVLAATAAAPSN